MVRVYYADDLLKQARKLTKKQQEKLAQLIVLLKENPYHPQLHVKSLSGVLSGVYSFRIVRDLRALFKFLSPDEIIIFEIGHRKDIYR